MMNKRQKTVIEAVDWLRANWGIPGHYLRAYKKSMKKEEAKDSYLFSEGIDISDRAYRSFVAWYRHTQTTYDEDIAQVMDHNIQLSIKKMYNTQLRNLMREWRTRKHKF
jgi:hypothetical protein